MGKGELSAASVGAMVGNAANLLPLSFSPLSYFGAGNAGVQTGRLGRRERSTQGPPSCSISTVCLVPRRAGQGQQEEGMWTQRRGR